MLEVTDIKGYVVLTPPVLARTAPAACPGIAFPHVQDEDMPRVMLRWSRGF
jgi:hypothetical protein